VNNNKYIIILVLTYLYPTFRVVRKCQIYDAKDDSILNISTNIKIFTQNLNLTYK